MPEQLLTKEQLAIRNEFCQTYNLEPNQLFFEAKSGEPYFDFPALAHLATELGDFLDISVSPMLTDALLGSTTVSCTVTSQRGFSRTATGNCAIGAKLPDGAIAGVRQAENVARARALRNALALAGFSAVRAHRLTQAQLSLRSLTPRTEEEQRRKELAQIHALRDKLGWNEKEYRDKLNIFFDVESSLQLTPAQRRECAETFRDLAALDTPTRAERITFARGAKWERERQRRLAQVAELPAAA